MAGDEAIWAVDDDGKRSADRLHASGVSIPEKVMDAFVMMRLAQMIDEGLVDEAIDRAIGEYRGNFGSMMLAKKRRKAESGFGANQTG